MRNPDGVAIIDERGEVTFGELHRRTNALARSLQDRGVSEGDGVAVMCRNHRGFIEASIAINKLGADVLYLNTAFAAPQLKDVVKREEPRVVVYDEEFEGLLEDVEIERPGDRLDRRRRRAPDTIEELIRSASSSDELSPPVAEPRARSSSPRARRAPRRARRGRRPASPPRSRCCPGCR